LTILVLVLIWILVTRLKRYWQSKKEKELLPHERALRELAELEKESLPEKGELQKFYFTLSAILRTYLNGRYDIKAMEKLPVDLQADIDSIKEINENQKSFLNNFLETTDFYKFANTASNKLTAQEFSNKVR